MINLKVKHQAPSQDSKKNSLENDAAMSILMHELYLLFSNWMNEDNYERNLAVKKSWVKNWNKHSSSYSSLGFLTTKQFEWAFANHP